MEIKTQNEQLVEYIKKNLKKSYTPDTLKYSLLSQGYSRTSIDKALEQAKEQLKQETPKITHTVHITQSISDDFKVKPEPSFFQKVIRKFR